MGYYNKASKLLHKVGTKEFRELCTTNIGAKPKLNAVDAALEEKGISTDGFTEEDYSKTIEELGQGGGSDVDSEEGYGPVLVRFTYISQATGRYITKGIRCRYGDSVVPPNIGDIKEIPGKCPDLTFQEWNHPLEMLNNVQHDLHLGASYVPTDNNIHIFIRADRANGSVTAPIEPTVTAALNFNYRSNSLIHIDWGDGIITVSTEAGFERHDYQSPGEYHIKIQADKDEIISNRPDYGLISARGIIMTSIWFSLIWESIYNLTNVISGSFSTIEILSMPNPPEWRIHRNIFMSPTPLSSNSIRDFVIPRNITIMQGSVYTILPSLTHYILSPAQVFTMGVKYALDDLHTVQSAIYINSISTESISDNFIYPPIDKLTIAAEIESMPGRTLDSGQLHILDLSALTKIPIMLSPPGSALTPQPVIIVADHLRDEWRERTNWNVFKYNIISKSDYERYYYPPRET